MNQPNTPTGPAATPPVATLPTPPASQALTHAQANEALWKIVGRFDTYIGSTNTKAAFLIAFNTFVPGSIVLKWQDIQPAFGDKTQAFYLVAFLLGLTLLASLASLAFTFMAISPFLKSPEEPGGYHSNIFFGHVCRHQEPEKYLEAVRKVDETSLGKDLAYQAHTLAKALTDKFWNIKMATRAVIVVLLALALSTGVYGVAIIQGVLEKVVK